MNNKEVKAIEDYFKTNNPHWNKYAFKILCEVLKQDIFENPIIPLSVFHDAIDIITENHSTPLRAIQLFDNEAKRLKLNTNQKLFVFNKVLEYARNTEFDFGDTGEFRDLLRSYIEPLDKELALQELKDKPVVSNIRGVLKELIQKELEQLPESLK